MPSYLRDAIKALGGTMKNLFRPPTTVHFPAQIRERSERYRTSFALLHDKEGEELCVGCLQCDKICPSNVITVVVEKRESPVTGKRRGYAKDFTLDLNACIYCELCVQVCPTDAIVMTRVPERPGFSREELCLTMDKLYENETAKPATWGTATLLMEMQDPKRGAPPKADAPPKIDAKADVKTDAKTDVKTDAPPTIDAKADAPAEKKADEET